MRPLFFGGIAAFSTTFLFCVLAQAQPKPAAPPPPPKEEPNRSSVQFALKREDAGGAEGVAARGRARAGDCQGALPLFDTAIKTTVESTLRRDRGLCHEKLGNPFPAMEDYRAYITASPDAPDAEQIRQRLSALEGQRGSKVAPSANEDANASASLSVQGSGGTANAVASTGATNRGRGNNVLGPKAGEVEHSYDYYVQQEKLADSADKSPLRSGSGIVLGAFLNIPRFFVGQGASSKLAYATGGTLRYSTGPTVTIMSELGFAGIGVSGENSASSGLLLLGGVELRLPVSRYAGDHILLRGGIGYERYVVSGTRAITHDLPARFGLGFRHVFGPSLGLELLFDGGPVLISPENGSSRVNGILGGSIAFVVGF